MSISKYTVVIILAIIALGTMAYGQYGAQQGQAIGASDKTLAVVGTLSSHGTDAFAILVTDPATRDQCLQSCAKTFPNKTSLGYKACANGCGKVPVKR